MNVFVINIELRAEWVHSLKEKRMVVQSLVQKIKNHFNVSAIESAKQDVHQTIAIAVAGLAANHAQMDSIIENIHNFVESNTDAEIIYVNEDILI